MFSIQNGMLILFHLKNYDFRTFIIKNSKFDPFQELTYHFTSTGYRYMSMSDIYMRIYKPGALIYIYWLSCRIVEKKKMMPFLLLDKVKTMEICIILSWKRHHFVLSAILHESH